MAFAGARLREALEREGHELAAIVDGATDVIVQVDESCRITRLNPAGERLLGLTRAEAIGRTCSDALGCEAAGGHRVANCPLAETIRTGRPIGYLETAIRGVQGADQGSRRLFAGDVAAGGRAQRPRSCAI